MFKKRICLRDCLLGLILVGLMQSTVAAPALSTQLERLHNYQANFSQTTYANAQITAKASGKVWIQRPWQMRWQVQKPNAQTLLVNGKTMVQISPDLNQATVRQMNPTELTNAGLLLASHADLSKTFIIKTLLEKKGLEAYQLTPKKPLQLTKIILYFNKQGLASMETWNTLGQRNSFDFSKVDMQAAMSSKVFKFIPAKGMDVLKAGV